jgi:hypothetical protein
MVIPPFSLKWVERMESIGTVPVNDQLRAELTDGITRERAWDLSLEVAQSARDAGFGGVILTGLRFDTVVDEAAGVWSPGRR